MDKVLDKVIAIIDRHIEDYKLSMEGVVSYELDMVECDCALSNILREEILSEAERLDRKWHDAFERRAELVSLREEILQAVVL